MAVGNSSSSEVALWPGIPGFDSNTQTEYELDLTH